MIPLYTTEQIREADSYAINELGIPGVVLMENAANSIVSILEEKFNQLPDANIHSIGIICGKGNNGGDGYAIARLLANKNYNVKILALSDQKSLKGDALINYRIALNYANQGLLEFSEYSELYTMNYLESCTVIVDAIFGTGIKGELKPFYADIVNQLNKYNSYKVAIDLPSGLDCDNGTGKPVFDADLTITLANYKKGLFFGNGYNNCGEVELGSIGIHNEYFSNLENDTFLLESRDAFAGLPTKSIQDYKYSAGKLFILAGSGRYPGAAILASNSATSSGTGAVKLAFPRSIKSMVHPSIIPVVMEPYVDHAKEYYSYKNFDEIKQYIDWANCLAIGPGLGKEEETIRGVQEIISKYPEKPMVIDAEALFAINENKWRNFCIKNKILTPHHKEFCDLIGISLPELNDDIMRYGKDFVKESGAILVLKGAPTIIFLPNGKTVINSVGNTGMAKFGTGDVLAGIIAGFNAQSKNMIASTLAAVYIHSLAADMAIIDEKNIYTLLPEDVIYNYTRAISEINNEFVPLP